MKNIYRLAIILGVFILVGFGIYAFVDSSAGQALFAGNGQGGGLHLGDAGTRPLAPGGNLGEADFHGERSGGGGTQWLPDLAKNVVIIALVTALVVGVQKAFKKIRRKPVVAAH